MSELSQLKTRIGANRSQSEGPMSHDKFFEQYLLSPNTSMAYQDIEDTSSKELEALDSLMRQTFIEVVEKHHPKVATYIKDYFRSAKSWVSDHNPEEIEGKIQQICQYLEALDPVQKILIASAFSHMLNLHNISEEVENTVREELERHGGKQVPHLVPTTNESIDLIMDNHKVSIQDVRKAVCSQVVELTFTAHPTQAIRSSILKKYSKIRQLLHKRLQILREEKRKNQLQAQSMYGITRISEQNESLDDFGFGNWSIDFDKMENEQELRSYVQAAWRTDEIRRSKPTPMSECRQGLSYIEDVIFNTVPRYIRELDNCLLKRGVDRIPLDHPMFRFGSWMGGDRDGNPNVTYQITRQVTLITRDKACELYIRQLKSLTDTMSMWRASQSFKEYVSHFNIMDSAQQFSSTLQRSRPDIREPYRVLLFYLTQKLMHTRVTLQRCLNTNENVKEALISEGCFYEAAQIYDPIVKMYESLIELNDHEIAHGLLLDLIRQVTIFGLSLLPLDIRQESTRHTEVMDQITQHLGIAEKPYSQWSEDEKLEFLVKELKGKRPLIPQKLEFDKDALEVIETMRMLEKLPRDSLRSYVISMTRYPSDILCVVLLQRECGVTNLLPVCPLFETLEDLQNSEESMKKLFQCEWYYNHIQGHQECMVGYSDSGKDAGRLASAWSLYTTQYSLVKMAASFNVSLSLFHGRGGTVGRGGGPTHMAVRSQPPGSIHGHIRVTCQGETIEQQFCEPEVCHRILDLYTSAVLEHRFQDESAHKKEYVQLMDQMARDSCSDFREYVKGNPKFVEYFIQSTPVKELAMVNIGSRPSTRKKQWSIDTLRAIPWVFGWTQVRFNLPVWLGVGDALAKAWKSGNQGILLEMYQDWPFFRVTLDMIAMVVGKSSEKIQQVYENELIEDDPELIKIGQILRAKFLETNQILSQVMQLSSSDIAGNQYLSKKITLRAPYLTLLNMLQIESIKGLRYLEMQKQGSNQEGQLQQEKCSHKHELFQKCKNYQHLVKGTALGAQMVAENQELIELFSRYDEGNRHYLEGCLEDTLVITIKGVAAGMQNTG